MNNFNKKDYDIKYKKELNQKRVYVDVDKEFAEQFDNILRKNKLSRTDIFVPAMEHFISAPEKFIAYIKNFK